MPDAALAIAHVMILWWFATGAILFLDGLPRHTAPWTVAGASVLMLAALVGLTSMRNETGVGAAHLGFACGLAVWGWNEVLFLTGTLTGSRRTACPPGARGWRRFRVASESVIYHEIAIALSAALLTVLLYDAPNQIGLWTFLVLWAMRLSAKLNIFLGVPNLGEKFLPDHLAYLASYFARRPMNFLFPVSITAATLVFAAMVFEASKPGTSDFETAGLTILATLIALAVVEHWFMVIPFDTAGLWRWGFKSRAAHIPSKPFPSKPFDDDTPAGPPARRHPEMTHGL